MKGTQRSRGTRNRLQIVIDGAIDRPANSAGARGTDLSRFKVIFIFFSPVSVLTCMNIYLYSQDVARIIKNSMSAVGEPNPSSVIRATPHARFL